MGGFAGGDEAGYWDIDDILISEESPTDQSKKIDKQESHPTITTKTPNTPTQTDKSKKSMVSHPKSTD